MTLPTLDSSVRQEGAPTVTVAVPTYNRAGLLKQTLESALAQDYPNFAVMVLDNASSDDTAAVVAAFNDPRVAYVRHAQNLGLLRNWQHAIARPTTTYVCVLQDDDLLLPGFIAASVAALEQDPRIALTASRSEGIDIDGAKVTLHEDPAPAGRLAGLDYLEAMVDGRNWVLRASSVMMRSSALDAVGNFDSPHSKHSIDVNLYMRLAAAFDFFLLPQLLCRVRIHEGQDTELRFRSGLGTGPLATMAERMDGIAHLMRSPRARDDDYRNWLSERAAYLSAQRSSLTAELLPELTITPEDRLAVALESARRQIPEASKLVLLDEETWRDAFEPFFDVTPFTERDGIYWGVPLDSDAAIEEIERQRRAGADYFVIAWPAFWWLDYYGAFRAHLTKNFRCSLKTSCLMIFHLREGAP